MNAIFKSDWEWAQGIVGDNAPAVSGRPTFTGLIFAALLTAQRDKDHDEFRRLGSTFPHCKTILIENQRRDAEELGRVEPPPTAPEPPGAPPGSPTSDDRPESASVVGDSKNVAQEPPQAIDQTDPPLMGGHVNQGPMS